MGRGGTVWVSVFVGVFVCKHSPIRLAYINCAPGVFETQVQHCAPGVFETQVQHCAPGVFETQVQHCAPGVFEAQVQHCAPGVFEAQVQHCAPRVFEAQVQQCCSIFSKNLALYNFVTHSFVSKVSLKFDEMTIFYSFVVFSNISLSKFSA